MPLHVKEGFFAQRAAAVMVRQALAMLLLIEALLNIVLFFQMRSLGGSGWMLVEGIITPVLGLMIYMRWPASSAWAIGTMVGTSMIISEVSRKMLSLAVRDVAAAVA